MQAAPMVIMAIAGGVQANAEVTAGKIEQMESEVAARSEEVAAVSREADRKRRLTEAVASQRARAGAAGIDAFSGSPLTIIAEDIRKEETATERDKFQTRLNLLTLRARGQVARQRGKGAAMLTLLKTAGDIAAVAPTGGKEIKLKKSTLRGDIDTSSKRFQEFASTA